MSEIDYNERTAQLFDRYAELTGVHRDLEEVLLEDLLVDLMRWAPNVDADFKDALGNAVMRNRAEGRTL